MVASPFFAGFFYSGMSSGLKRGVPVGGELEYVDAGTIARAMLDRRSV